VLGQALQEEGAKGGTGPSGAQASVGRMEARRLAEPVWPIARR